MTGIITLVALSNQVIYYKQTYRVIPSYDHNNPAVHLVLMDQTQASGMEYSGCYVYIIYLSN